jgi:hypothetical protein
MNTVRKKADMSFKIKKHPKELLRVSQVFLEGKEFI